MKESRVGTVGRIGGRDDGEESRYSRKEKWM